MDGILGLPRGPVKGHFWAQTLLDQREGPAGADKPGRRLRVVATHRWRPSVETNDEDPGRSGSGLVARPGFERLIASVCTGSVGAAFCLQAPASPAMDATGTTWSISAPWLAYGSSTTRESTIRAWSTIGYCLV